MFENLQNLYRELECLDLNLILCAQSGEYQPIREGLALRHDCLDQLVKELAQGEFTISERNAIRQSQDHARARHDRLMEVFGKLRDGARAAFMKVAGPRRQDSPYARAQGPVRRVRA